MFKEFEFAGKKYEMDERGNIKSLYKTKTGFRKCFPDKDGYLKFAVQDLDRNTHNGFIHRLVYQVWNGEIPEWYTVDHDDGDKLNNHKDNLKLLSAIDNAIKGNAKHWRFLNPDGALVEIYNLKAFCKEHNLHNSHMVDVHNEKKSHYQHKGWRKYYD